MHADGGGLYLQVDATGSRRWLAFVFFRGRRLEMGLGPLAALSLAEAREAAAQARRQAKAGTNPVEARRRLAASARAVSFGQLAREVVEHLRPGWRNPKVATQWLTTLTVDAKALEAIPVDQVDTDDVLGVLRPIWTVKPETANRLRGRIERVLDTAKARGMREGDNPARWRGHLSILLPAQRRQRRNHPALPYDRIKTFFADLRRLESISAAALDFTILTNSRSNESLGARGAEINLEQGVWTVPAARTKRGVEYRVPLSPPALAIARRRMDLGGHGFLFPGLKRGRPLSSGAMPKILRLLGYKGITVHGFRSTFKDWSSDKTEFAREIIEQAMGHLVGDEAEQAYRRSDALDRRRALLEAWADYCEPARNNVVRLKA